MGALNKAGAEISDSRLSAVMLGGLIAQLKDNTFSGKLAKVVFEALWNGVGDADTIIAARGLEQITDAGDIEGIVEAIIAAKATQYRAGKDKLLGFFAG